MKFNQKTRINGKNDEKNGVKTNREHLISYAVINQPFEYKIQHNFTENLENVKISAYTDKKHYGSY